MKVREPCKVARLWGVPMVLPNVQGAFPDDVVLWDF